MKKYILSLAVIIIVVLILIAIGSVYLSPKENERLSEKTTKGSVAELFGQKYDRPADTVIIEIGNDTGSFAKGTVRFADEFGGGVWFAAKTVQGWELAFDGNGIVSCAAANKYDFPRDMIPQCLDTQNGNKLIER